ncbi:hypothetical protein FBQ85_19310, partial [Cytophagia bacterium CHB2]|nr:hypothetical protein [Cytophagia bacterium CHB2]
MKTHVVRVLLLLLIAALSRAAEPDAKLVQANAQQTTIDLKLTGFKFDTLRVGGAMLGVIQKFANSFSAENPGAPDLPHRV